MVTNNWLSFPLVATGFLLVASCTSAAPDAFSVRDFGAQGDGKTDDTAAFQKALDTAAQAGGGSVQAGRGTVGFSDCTFVQWDSKKENRAALQASGGTLMVRGCEFQTNKPQIELGAKVKRAVITGNIVRGKTRITNNSTGVVEISGNAGDQQE